MTKRGLDRVYELNSADASKAFYDGWAEGYEAELGENGYATPQRCAETLAAHAASPWAPLAEFGCGTGLGGLALASQGFECIDGFDISENMLARAADKDIYRTLVPLDMAQPLIDVPAETYQNAAAIGVFNPSFMPASVLDDILGLIPSGGCFVFSLNDHALAERSFEARLMEIVEYNVADLLVKDHGDHLPGIGLQSTVYLLKKR